jgi:hypothetical protein
MDTMSELNVVRIGGDGFDDNSSMGGQSYLEIHQYGDNSSASGSVNVIGGNQSESSYAMTETGI